MIGSRGFHWMMFSVVLSGAVGCSSGMDGTWVFQWDLANIQEASTLNLDGESHSVDGPECSSEGSYPVRDLGGTDYSFVEIYLTQGTGIVISVDGQELVGDVTGTSFDVEASHKEVNWADEDTYDQWEWLLTLGGTLADGEITGQQDFKLIDGEGFPTTECLYQSRLKYTAVKLTTENKPDRSTGTSGTGIASQGEVPSTGSSEE